MKLVRIIATTTCLLISINVMASNYSCKIMDGANTSSIGTLESLSSFNSQRIGHEFIVDRNTGLISGQSFSNSHSKLVKVLNSGDSENSFKSIALYGPNQTMEYLVIKEYHDNKVKPFTFLNGQSDVFTGGCKKF